MRVKVVRPFKDKHTKVICKLGQDIEVTKERYEELTSAALGPFVEKVEIEKVETAENEQQKKPQNKPAQRKTTNKAKK